MQLLVVYNRSRRVRHGLVDCMQESVHALCCNFLCLQGIYAELADQFGVSQYEYAYWLVRLFHGERSRFRKIAELFSGSRSSEAVGIYRSLATS